MLLSAVPGLRAAFGPPRAGSAPQPAMLRASSPRMLDVAGSGPLIATSTFLLAKLDLAAIRAEREALERTLDEIDRNANAIGTGVPVAPVAPMAPVVPAQQAEVAVAAAKASGGFDLVSFLLHPIAPLLPIPFIAIPALIVFVVLPRLTQEQPKAQQGGPMGAQEGLLEGLAPKFDPKFNDEAPDFFSSLVAFVKSQIGGDEQPDPRRRGHLHRLDRCAA